ARLVAIALALVVLASPAHADPIPAEKRALILLRVLAYDHQLARRTGDDLVVVVVYRGGDKRSEAAATELVAALAEAARQVSVAGRAVRATRLAYSNGLEGELARTRTAAAYVCTGLEG